MFTNIKQLLEIYKVESEEELNWNWISIDQKLSEEFIEKYLNKVNWFCIPRFQTLSKEFLLKHWEKIPILSVVKKCGNQKRVIYRLKESPELIFIGCFEGTKEEAIKAIQEKYKEKPIAMQQYIDKVEECFNSALID